MLISLQLIFSTGKQYGIGASAGPIYESPVSYESSGAIYESPPSYDSPGPIYETSPVYASPPKPVYNYEPEPITIASPGPVGLGNSKLIEHVHHHIHHTPSVGDTPSSKALFLK